LHLEDFPRSGVVVTVTSNLRNPPESVNRVRVDVFASFEELLADVADVAPTVADQLGILQDGQVVPDAGYRRFSSCQIQRLVDSRSEFSVDLGVTLFKLFSDLVDLRVER
jgi:hypothetical protein